MAWYKYYSVSRKAALNSKANPTYLPVWNYNCTQRTLTIGGSITVRLASCLTSLDSTKQVNL